MSGKFLPFMDYGATGGTLSLGLMVRSGAKRRVSNTASRVYPTCAA